MKKLKNCLFLSLFTSPVWALPLPCMNDTLTNYLASGFSCTIGDKTFASFAAIFTATAALGGTATPVSTDNVTVQPSGGSLDPPLPLP